MYFKIYNAKLYNNEVGYASMKCEAAKNIDVIIDLEKYNKFLNENRLFMANDLEVSIDDVIAIDRDEYLEATENEDDEE